MLNDLLWFSGITWDTPLREIGWTYVLIAVLLAVAIHFIAKALNP